MSDALEQSLLAEIAQIRAVDTHSHLPGEASYLESKPDALSLLQCYVNGDLVSAGCPPETVAHIADATRGSVAERWELLAPWWRRFRTGSYGRMWERTVTGLLGAPEISAEGLEQATARMRELHQPGLYRHVMSDLCNLQVSLLDRGDPSTGLAEADRETFLPVVRPHQFLFARSQFDLVALEREFGLRLHRLEALAHGLESYLAGAQEQGAVAVKLTLAYQRSLQVDKPSQHEAETLFNRIFQGRGEGLSWAEAKPLQDYLLHRCLQAALDLDLTVIFHTGLQAGGVNLVADTNPTLLNTLLMEYRDLRIDLFHAGYPYVRECAVLAKYFPNVWADLAWMHLISAAGVREFLPDWLDLVPAGKILGFGADLFSVEMVWGHLALARENLAAVLAQRVRRGYDTEAQALDLARLMLREAPAECYRLGLSG